MKKGYNVQSTVGRAVIYFYEESLVLIFKNKYSILVPVPQVHGIHVWFFNKSNCGYDSENQT
jgi:hypothetical protein